MRFAVSLLLILFINIIINNIYTETYKFRNKKANIKEIQIQLLNLGYIPDLEGKYGIKTKFTVIAFQKVNRIIIDGIIFSCKSW